MRRLDSRFTLQIVFGAALVGACQQAKPSPGTSTKPEDVGKSGTSVWVTSETTYTSANAQLQVFHGAPNIYAYVVSPNYAGRGKGISQVALFGADLPTTTCQVAAADQQTAQAFKDSTIAVGHVFTNPNGASSSIGITVTCDCQAKKASLNARVTFSSGGNEQLGPVVGPEKTNKCT